MPKNKSHKGLLKRVRISKTGRIKLQRACGRHLRSHKSGQKIRDYRRPKYASVSDARRLRSLLQPKISPPTER
jgi:large subunit ribosomal protein L35